MPAVEGLRWYSRVRAGRRVVELGIILVQAQVFGHSWSRSPRANGPEVSWPLSVSRGSRLSALVSNTAQVSSLSPSLQSSLRPC